MPSCCSPTFLFLQPGFSYSTATAVGVRDRPGRNLLIFTRLQHTHIFSNTSTAIPHRFVSISMLPYTAHPRLKDQVQQVRQDSTTFSKHSLLDNPFSPLITRSAYLARTALSTHRRSFEPSFLLAPSSNPQRLPFPSTYYQPTPISPTLYHSSNHPYILHIRSHSQAPSPRSACKRLSSIFGPVCPLPVGDPVKSRPAC